MSPPLRFPPLLHIAVTVSDFERSKDWYGRLFGRPAVGEQQENGFRSAVWMDPIFGLHHFPDGTDTPFDERKPGLDHIAFGCASRDELVTWVARLDELGIRHGGIVDLWYGSGLSFRDPDNIALEFFWSARAD